MVTKPNALLAGFIDLMMDAVFAVDAEANIVFASASCERIFGYTPGEMIGGNMFNFMHPADRELTRNSVVAVMSGQPQYYFENRYLHKDGHVLHIMWSAQWSEVEQLRIGVARDITGRKRADSLQTALYSISHAAFSAEDLLKLFQHIHQIVGTLLPVDNFSVTLYDEESGQLSFPYHVDEFQPTPELCTLVPGTLYAEIIHSGQPLLLTRETARGRLDEIQLATGRELLCWLGVPLKSHNGTLGVLVLKSYPQGQCYSQQDLDLLQFVSTQIATVIERQQLEVKLRYMAQYDQLTALPNRGFLYDRLKVALAAARQGQGELSLLYLDLDKFKQVNDTLGHAVGDLLLQEVATRLKQCVGESDSLARVGGDEFVILLQGTASGGQAALVMQKIRHAFSHAFSLNGNSLTMVPSIGVARYPEHGLNERQLLEHADKGMYSDKKAKNH